MARLRPSRSRRSRLNGSVPGREGYAELAAGEQCRDVITHTNIRQSFVANSDGRFGARVGLVAFGGATAQNEASLADSEAKRWLKYADR
jgi:hypothetical protein